MGNSFRRMCRELCLKHGRTLGNARVQVFVPAPTRRALQFMRWRCSNRCQVSPVVGRLVGNTRPVPRVETQEMPYHCAQTGVLFPRGHDPPARLVRSGDAGTYFAGHRHYVTVSINSSVTECVCRGMPAANRRSRHVRHHVTTAVTGHSPAVTLGTGNAQGTLRRRGQHGT